MDDYANKENILQVYKKGNELGPEANLSQALSALLTQYFDQCGVTGTFYFPDPTPYFLHLVRCKFGADQHTGYPCTVRTMGKEKDFEDNNVFLAGVNEEPNVALNGYWKSDGNVNAGRQSLDFRPLPSSSFGYFTAWFIKKPLDITVSQEPESHVSTHKAIVARAFVELLQKAERNTTEAYGIYTQILGSIL